MPCGRSQTDHVTSLVLELNPVYLEDGNWHQGRSFSLEESLLAVLVKAFEIAKLSLTIFFTSFEFDDDSPGISFAASLSLPPYCDVNPFMPYPHLSNLLL